MECDCQTQMTLRKHYLLSNIGDQYMRLDWDQDFDGSEDAKDAVKTYLDGWGSFRMQGMGMEFSSPDLGVGKTFAVTHIARSLIKSGVDVLFVPFLEVISFFSSPNQDEEVNRLKSTTVLILDEVIPPRTSAQSGLFADKFEELIRHRTNFNLPTIMTTNLNPKVLRDYYSRSYSLLEAKQIRVQMSGHDARQGIVAHNNIELALNEEVRPIC